LLSPDESPKEKLLTMSRRLLLTIPLIAVVGVLAAAVAALSSEQGTSVADALTTMMAVLAVAGAIISVLAARDQHRKERTLEYVERINDPETFEARGKLLRFIQPSKPPAFVNRQTWEALPEHERKSQLSDWAKKTKAEREKAKLAYLGTLDHEETLQLFSYLNLLEEVAGSMGLRILHKPTVRRHILPVSEIYYELSLPWIKTFRKRLHDSEIWEYWEAMHREFEREE
jgi:hypothetical protein